jgi:hypothetical protein
MGNPVDDDPGLAFNSKANDPAGPSMDLKGVPTEEFRTHSGRPGCPRCGAALLGKPWMERTWAICETPRLGRRSASSMTQATFKSGPPIGSHGMLTWQQGSWRFDVAG